MLFPNAGFQIIVSASVLTVTQLQRRNAVVVLNLIIVTKYPTLKKEKKIYDIVEANRAKFIRYFATKNDTNEVSSQKLNQLVKELKPYLYHNSKQVFNESSNSNQRFWDGAYKLTMPDMVEFPVFRNLWLAVNGLSVNLIKRLEKEIRYGKGKTLTVGVLDGIDDVNQYERIIYHFDIDIEGVNSYIESFIELDKVP